jgi:hypothetical protein
MTLQEFEHKLKELLRAAEDSGLDVEEFCQLTEHILENGWAPEEQDND